MANLNGAVTTASGTGNTANVWNADSNLLLQVILLLH